MFSGRHRTTRTTDMSSPHPGFRDCRVQSHLGSSIQKAEKYSSPPSPQWTQTLAKAPDHTGDREAYHNPQSYFWKLRSPGLLCVLCAQSFSRVRLFPTSDHSPPGSSVHGILQERILEWVAISYSKGSSQSRDWTCICLALLPWQADLYHWAPRGGPM